MTNQLRNLRLKAGLSQDEMAARMGTTRSTYVKLERGERRLTQKWIERAAMALRVAPGRIIERGLIPMTGCVGAGAEVFPFDENRLEDVEAPPGSRGNVAALWVKGDSMRGIADEGWIIYYDDDDRRMPVTDDLLGQVCVVGLVGGRALVKKLQKGRMPGLFDLYSSNFDPMFDQPVEWAAKVTWIKPR
jgi:transcriptional regulator with XRE-family HTH domain